MHEYINPSSYRCIARVGGYNVPTNIVGCRWDTPVPLVISPYIYGGNYDIFHAPTGVMIAMANTIEEAFKLPIEELPGYYSNGFSAITAREEEMRRLHRVPEPVGGQLIVDWKYREEQRFLSGQYQRLPNSLYHQFYWTDQFPEHYVHVAKVPGGSDMVSYTPSDQYGKADRQVRVRFGRYLKKYYPNMPESTILGMSEKLLAITTMECSPVELKFTTKRHVISEIFETPMCADGGTSYSCMYGKFTAWDERPYHVYADSPDVAVAYITKGPMILARSVVSMKDKNYIRLYSNRDNDKNYCRVLQEMLEEQGFNRGSLEGNRLTKLKPRHGDVVLPYIDYDGMCVYEHPVDNYWVVVEVGDDRAEYRCNNTDGTAEEIEQPDPPTCHRCCELEDECRCELCSCCDNMYDPHDGDCPRCEFCDGCRECVTHNDCECEPEEEEEEDTDESDNVETDAVVSTASLE